MTKSKYLFKNVTILNILLIAAIILMANYTVLPLLHIDIKYTLPFQKKTVDEKEVMPVEHNPPSPSDYMIISEANLFHPERIIPPEKKEEPPLPKPDIVLYGILIADDISLAYIEDLKAPRTTQGRGKRQIPLRKGDTFSGFTLKEIETDKIVMVRGEEKMTVFVHDPHRPKTREVVTTASQPTPGQPARPLSPTQAPSSKPYTPPSPESLIKREPPTKNRAPMTPADEKILNFFKRP